MQSSPFQPAVQHRSQPPRKLRLAVPGAPLASEGDVEQLNGRFVGQAGIDLAICPVVLAELRASVEDMQQCLALRWRGRGCSPETARRNQDYLQHARLLCQQVLAGQTHRLIEMRLTLSEAQFLASLTTAQIEYLSAAWGGDIAAPIPVAAPTNPRDRATGACMAVSAVTAFNIPSFA